MAMVFNKKYYHLWWEYLKRSELYKLWCLKRSYSPSPIFDFKVMAASNARIDTILQNIALKFTFDTFGNVHESSYDDWWKSRRFPEPVKDLSKAYKNDFPLFLAYHTYIRMRPLTAEEVYGSFGDFLESYEDHVFLKIRVSAKDKDIRDAVSRAVSTRKKKHTLQLDVLEKYLKVYDGRKAGKSNDEIASDVFERDTCGYKQPRHGQTGEKNYMADKEISDYLHNYEAFAQQIIKNVELGVFPGEYRKTANSSRK